MPQANCRPPPRLSFVAAVMTLICAFFASSATHAEDLPNGDTAQCENFYSPGDPALFTFVKTRKQIDFGAYAGMTISSVEYVVLPIFNPDDPDENNWLYRSANWLHIDTREKTLKKQMIVYPGDALSTEKLLENERILRNNGYLVDAMIVPKRVCGNSIELLVVVRDIWTFSPEANASRSGGTDSTGAGITESNLFGTGQRISVGYFQDEDRNGTTLDYRVPLIYGRSNFEIGLADNSDGDLISASLIRPFYEFNSHWSTGVVGSKEHLTQYIRSNGELINQFNQTSEFYTIFGGWSPGRQNGSVTRLNLGYTEENDQFSAQPDTLVLPDDEVIRYPWMSVSYQEDKFQTADNINRTHRQEDIQLGFAHFAQLGYASEDLGSDDDALVFFLESGYATYLSKHQLLRTGIYFDGVRDGETLRSAFFGATSDYYYFINEKNRWFARIEFDGTRGARQDEQLTIGGNDSLRGYPLDYQRGNRRWLMSIERRRFTNIHILNLAYFGFAGYVDVGKVWDTETVNSPNTDTLADIGFGMRFSPSKFRIDKVIHVDIAAPLVNVDEVDDYQLIITGRVDF